MTAYEQIWPVAEDHYGIITAAKARELGVSKQSMSAMVQSGRLTRLGHGVYQVQHNSAQYLTNGHRRKRPSSSIGCTLL